MTQTLARPAEDTRPAVPVVPTPLVMVAGAVLTAGVLTCLLGAWRTGLSWDESYHVMRLRNFLEYGWYVLDGDLDGGRPGAWEDQRYVYGPATTLLLHGWSVLWGTETPGEVSTTATAYAVRHLGVALIGLAGVAAAAGLARLLLRTWSWALVAGAALVAVPTWTGHAMFNLKDVPVATGYTTVTLGVALLVARRPGERTRLLAAAALVVAGTLLATGTRPGIWPGIALAYGLGSLTRDRTRLATLVGCGALSLGLLWLLYPAVFGNPVVAMLESVTESSRFDDKQGYWWYLPLYLLIELPTVLLLAGAAGAVIAARRLRSDLRQRTVLALVLAQTFALPLVAVVGRSNLYTGLRQLLFAAPGLAVLVTVALAALLARPRPGRQWSGRQWSGRQWSGRQWSGRQWLAGVVLAVPMLAQLPLFPYAYAYSSAPATLVAPRVAERDPRLEVQTDYWRTSVRELAPQIPAGGFVTCSPTLRDGVFLRRSNETADDCGSALVGPLAPYDGARTLPWEPSPTEFLAVRTGNGTVAGNCLRLGEVTRRLYWREVVMSTVSRCELVLEPNPPAGMRFDGTGLGGGYLLGGWRLHHTEPGAVLRAGRSAEVGVTLDGVGAVRISGTATGLDGARLTVNGAPVPVAVSRDRLSAEVPAGIVAAYGEGRLVVRLTAGASDLHLLALTVSPA